MAIWRQPSRAKEMAVARPMPGLGVNFEMGFRIVGRESQIEGREMIGGERKGEGIPDAAPVTRATPGNNVMMQQGEMDKERRRKNFKLGTRCRNQLMKAAREKERILQCLEG
jgi:hypothetical protein